MAVKPVSITLDVAGYQYDNKPMGDHYPLIATFTIDEDSTTGIGDGQWSTVNVQSESWFDLQGRHVDTPATGVYIQNGHKFIAK